ncbi:MAG TPA: uroporphyrinogen-III synthase [Sulfuricella sp.]|nr:uroporphyrinogen-III synthase [Sulfuricella sp.]
MKPLAGLGVLVTRPAHLAGHLAELIERAGGRAILFPTLEIFDAKDMSVLSAIIDRLEQFDLAIFISPNAVNKAMSLIRARRAWPQGLRCAAVGKGSGKALAQLGIDDVLVPQGRFDSEALLALPELQDVAGKQVVIFRGEGGRELLGEELTRRGAGVTFAECYRRGKPVGADVEALLKRWAHGEVGAVTVTSGESMRNLFDLVGTAGQAFLKKTPVFAFHEGIAEVARELGAEQVYVTPPGDDGLLDGLIAWRQNT